MNLLSIASSLDQLGRLASWDKSKVVLSQIDENMERLEIWYVLRFGRKVPPPSTPLTPPPDLRLELLAVSHTLSNLEIAINMGLAEHERCSGIALEALQNLRAIRGGIYAMQQNQGNDREMMAGA